MSIRPLAKSQILSSLGRVNKFPYPVRVGTDICHIPQIRDLLTKKDHKFAEPFLRRVLTERERDDYKKRVTERGQEAGYEFLAGRWAAKEAIIKAATPTRLTFHDITIRPAVINPDATRSEGNRPPVAEVLFSQDARVHELPISISHHQDYAMATCVAFDFVEIAREGLREIYEEAVPDDGNLDEAAQTTVPQAFTKSDRENLVKLLGLAASLDREGLNAAITMVKHWKDAIESERQNYMRGKRQNLLRVMAMKAQALKAALWVDPSDKSQEVVRLAKRLQNIPEKDRGSFINKYVAKQYAEEMERLNRDIKSWRNVWHMIKETAPPSQEPFAVLSEIDKREADRLATLIRNLNLERELPQTLEYEPRAVEDADADFGTDSTFLSKKADEAHHKIIAPEETSLKNDSELESQPSNQTLIMEELKLLKSQVARLATKRSSMESTARIAQELQSLRSQLADLKAEHASAASLRSSTATEDSKTQEIQRLRKALTRERQTLNAEQKKFNEERREFYDLIRSIEETGSLTE